MAVERPLEELGAGQPFDVVVAVTVRVVVVVMVVVAGVVLGVLLAATEGGGQGQQGEGGEETMGRRGGARHEGGSWFGSGWGNDYSPGAGPSWAAGSGRQPPIRK